MAEEIDLEKCTFRNFGSSVTLDRVEVTLVRICGRGLTTHQIRWKSEKLFVDVRTYGRTDVRTDGRTHLSSNLLGHRRGDDLKMDPERMESGCIIRAETESMACTTNNTTVILDRIGILCMQVRPIITDVAWSVGLSRS